MTLTKIHRGPETKPAKPVARFGDSARHRADQEAETHRLMTNWALWKAGASISMAVTAAWGLEAKGRREAVSVPLLNGEATDVDSAVEALPPELQDVVKEHWLKKGTAEKHARSCRCALRTYYDRLKHAHERVRALMRAKRDQAERARRIYRSGTGESLNKPLPNG